MMQEIKTSRAKISPKNGNDDNKDYLCDSEFQSSVQIEHSQDCIDTEPILTELNIEFDSELESKQRDNKHRK